MFFISIRFFTPFHYVQNDSSSINKVVAERGSFGQSPKLPLSAYPNTIIPVIPMRSEESLIFI